MAMLQYKNDNVERIIQNTQYLGIEMKTISIPKYCVF